MSLFQTNGDPDPDATWFRKYRWWLLLAAVVAIGALAFAIF